MILHQNNNEFRAAIASTANALDMQEHIVEKDYWVTYLLKRISSCEFHDYLVFKGGTSLSKAYGLIKRFSEDVDIALKPEAISKGVVHKRSGSAIHKIIKLIKPAEFINHHELKESEKKRYKRAYQFPTLCEYPTESPIHDKIILELNSYSNPLPIERIKIDTLISKYIGNQLSKSEIDELELGSFEINVLKPERTFCEKILAIRRASYKGGKFFAARIRHLYDIYHLFHTPRINEFIKSNDFVSMLEKCFSDDSLNQKITSDTQQKIYEADIFCKPREMFEGFVGSYEKLRDVIFDRVLPEMDELEKTLELLAVYLKDAGKVC